MVSSLPALFLAAGILVVYILGTFLKWDALALSCTAFPALLFCLLLFLPESPVWLKRKGRIDKAEVSLKWLNRKTNGDEIESVTTIADLTSKTNTISRSGAPFWSRQVLVPFSLVAGILVFQQICGINTVIFYTVIIFQESGSTIEEYLATILVGLVQLLATIISVLLVDYFGRKPLLFTSGLLMSISMSGLGAYFYLHKRELASNLGLLPLISQLVFMVGYSIGYCSIPFILMGELLPLKYRSLLSSISGACNLGSMFLVLITFPLMAAAIGLESVFWIYAGCSFISCIFVYFLLPETKGQTYEEIQRYFEQKYPLTEI